MDISDNEHVPNRIAIEQSHDSNWHLKTSSASPDRSQIVSICREMMSTIREDVTRMVPIQISNGIQVEIGRLVKIELVILCVCYA